VYAFLGIAQAWHGLRRAPHLEPVAIREFAKVRAQVEAGMAGLDSASLID
jgi:hypothetical protein